MNDKGAIVALPYGVEGFSPLRHLIKAEGVQAKEEENLEFKVIEFSKENKKIILSHSKVHQEVSNSSRTKETEEGKKKAKDTKKAVKKIKDNLEKTTLGDIDALANLKTEMTRAETKEKSARKPEKPEELNEEKPKEQSPEQPEEKTEE
jgi:small subunit ribosomal protein S1